MSQLSLFGPNPCQCGQLPFVQFMPNYSTLGQWQVFCAPRCRRVFASTEAEAIHNYNQGQPA